jgi:hypothetical protein
MTPNFVAARPGAIKSKTKYAESPHDLAVRESCQPPHYGTATGTRNSCAVRCLFRKIGGSGSPFSRQDSTIFLASPCAISTVSATLRPSATRPGTSGLVPRYRPFSKLSTRTRIPTSSTSATRTCRFIAARSPSRFPIVAECVTSAAPAFQRICDPCEGFRTAYRRSWNMFQTKSPASKL